MTRNSCACLAIIIIDTESHIGLHGPLCATGFLLQRTWLSTRHSQVACAVKTLFTTTSTSSKLTQEFSLENV